MGVEFMCPKRGWCNLNYIRFIFFKFPLDQTLPPVTSFSEFEYKKVPPKTSNRAEHSDQKRNHFVHELVRISKLAAFRN
jgi:hypothetical protein